MLYIKIDYISKYLCRTSTIMNFLYFLVCVCAVFGRVMLQKVNVNITTSQLGIFKFNSDALPSSVRFLNNRSATWFSNERCPLKMFNYNHDGSDFISIRRITTGFGGGHMFPNKMFAFANTTNRIYYFEYPINSNEMPPLPTVLWIYTRPQFRINSGRLTKPEVLECLNFIKLSSLAEEQVGLTAYGEPKRNKEIYKSMESYKHWSHQKMKLEKHVSSSVIETNHENIKVSESKINSDDSNNDDYDDDDDDDSDSDIATGVISKWDSVHTIGMSSAGSVVFIILVIILTFLKVRARRRRLRQRSGLVDSAHIPLTNIESDKMYAEINFDLDKYSTVNFKSKKPYLYDYPPTPPRPYVFSNDDDDNDKNLDQKKTNNATILTATTNFSDKTNITTVRVHPRMTETSENNSNIKVPTRPLPEIPEIIYEDMENKS